MSAADGDFERGQLTAQVKHIEKKVDHLLAGMHDGVRERHEQGTHLAVIEERVGSLSESVVAIEGSVKRMEDLGMKAMLAIGTVILGWILSVLR